MAAITPAGRGAKTTLAVLPHALAHRTDAPAGWEDSRRQTGVFTGQSFNLAWHHENGTACWRVGPFN